MSEHHPTERDYSVRIPAHLDDIIDDGQWLRVAYECECGNEWSDEWSCACDDECSSCGATIEATSWEDISDERAPDLADCLSYRCVGSDALVDRLRYDDEPTAADLDLAGKLLRGEAIDD